MTENIVSARRATIFFNIFMWMYQASVSWLCLYYRVYILLGVLLINFCFSNYNWYNIRKGKYIYAIKVIYIELVIFMAAGTVSLGMSYGFYLYGISLITCLYYVNYMSIRIRTKSLNEPMVLAAIVCSYTFSSVYTLKYGPVYVINNTIANMFFAGNSAMVFGVLVIYMRMYIELIKKTERQLEEIAHRDKLTGLYNRHYFLSYMEEFSPENLKNYWIAILDIDNFKKVNDTYGHNGGDYILKNVASITGEFFSECVVCRWGGEEFIVLASGDKVPDSRLDDMRRTIADTVMNFENQELKVTVTVGTERYSDGLSTDQWISAADAKLYEGKNSGKNKVVY